jgi:hypothetical protein
MTERLLTLRVNDETHELVAGDFVGRALRDLAAGSGHRRTKLSESEWTRDD